jgi:hypothetical protein
MEIRFHGRLTEDEFRLAHSLMQPRLYRAWWLLPILTVVAVLVLRPYVPGVLRIGAALVGFCLVYRFWARRYVLRRTWKKARSLYAPVKGTVSEAGMHWSVEGVSSNEMSWRGLETYVETEDLILVYHAPNQALAVCRRYFPSLAGWNEFRKLLSEKVASARR